MIIDTDHYLSITEAAAELKDIGVTKQILQHFVIQNRVHGSLHFKGRYYIPKDSLPQFRLDYLKVSKKKRK